VLEADTLDLVIAPVKPLLAAPLPGSVQPVVIDNVPAVEVQLGPVVRLGAQVVVPPSLDDQPAQKLPHEVGVGGVGQRAPEGAIVVEVDVGDVVGAEHLVPRRRLVVHRHVPHVVVARPHAHPPPLGVGDGAAERHPPVPRVGPLPVNSLVRPAAPLEANHLDLVIPRAEEPPAAPVARAVQPVVVDNAPAVDVEPRAVVAVGAKRVVPSAPDLDLPGKLPHKVVVRHPLHRAREGAVVLEHNGVRHRPRPNQMVVAVVARNVRHVVRPLPNLHVPPLGLHARVLRTQQPLVVVRVGSTVRHNLVRSAPPLEAHRLDSVQPAVKVPPPATLPRSVQPVIRDKPAVIHIDVAPVVRCRADRVRPPPVHPKHPRKLPHKVVVGNSLHRVHEVVVVAEVDRPHHLRPHLLEALVVARHPRHVVRAAPHPHRPPAVLGHVVAIAPPAVHLPLVLVRATIVPVAGHVPPAPPGVGPRVCERLERPAPVLEADTLDLVIAPVKPLLAAPLPGSVQPVVIDNVPAVEVQLGPVVRLGAQVVVPPSLDDQPAQKLPHEVGVGGVGQRAPEGAIVVEVDVGDVVGAEHLVPRRRLVVHRHVPHVVVARPHAHPPPLGVGDGAAERHPPVPRVGPLPVNSLVRPAAPLEANHLDLVIPRAEEPPAAPVARAVQPVVVDNAPAVDVEPRAVVAVGAKRVVPSAPDLDLPGKLPHKVVVRHPLHRAREGAVVLEHNGVRHRPRPNQMVVAVVARNVRHVVRPLPNLHVPPLGLHARVLRTQQPLVVVRVGSTVRHNLVRSAPPLEAHRLDSVQPAVKVPPPATLPRSVQPVIRDKPAVIHIDVAPVVRCRADRVRPPPVHPKHPRKLPHKVVVGNSLHRVHEVVVVAEVDRPHHLRPHLLEALVVARHPRHVVRAAPHPHRPPAVLGHVVPPGTLEAVPAPDATGPSAPQQPRVSVSVRALPVDAHEGAAATLEANGLDRVFAPGEGDVPAPGAGAVQAVVVDHVPTAHPQLGTIVGPRAELVLPGVVDADGALCLPDKVVAGRPADLVVEGVPVAEVDVAHARAPQPPQATKRRHAAHVPFALVDRNKPAAAVPPPAVVPPVVVVVPVDGAAVPAVPASLALVPPGAARTSLSPMPAGSAGAPDTLGVAPEPAESARATGPAATVLAGGAPVTAGTPLPGPARPAPPPAQAPAAPRPDAARVTPQTLASCPATPPRLPHGTHRADGAGPPAATASAIVAGRAGASILPAVTREAPRAARPGGEPDVVELALERLDD